MVTSHETIRNLTETEQTSEVSPVGTQVADHFRSTSKACRQRQPKLSSFLLIAAFCRAAGLEATTVSSQAFQPSGTRQTQANKQQGSKPR
jgi:hypothetical protein